MMKWLYEMVRRVPVITDEEIAEMIRIEPVEFVPDSGMFRLQSNGSTVDPRKTAFNWDVMPVGEEFTFDQFNMTEIVTQHSGSYLFKPSLDEVYAWIRLYFADNWKFVRFFCLGDASRIAGTTDFVCRCTVMGGPMLMKGESSVLPNGDVCWSLVRKEVVR